MFRPGSSLQYVGELEAGTRPGQHKVQGYRYPSVGHGEREGGGAGEKLRLQVSGRKVILEVIKEARFRLTVITYNLTLDRKE